MKFLALLYFAFIPFFRVVLAIVFIFNLCLALFIYWVLTKKIFSTGIYLALMDGKPSLISTISLYRIVALFPIFAYAFRLIALKMIPKAYASMFPEIKSNPTVNTYLNKWN